MKKSDLQDLSTEALQERKRNSLKGYIISMVLVSLFAAYLAYLDLVKGSEYSHLETYLLILVGVLAITIELIIKRRRISRELMSRTNKK